jgi:hypothetical protein
MGVKTIAGQFSQTQEEVGVLHGNQAESRLRGRPFAQIWRSQCPTTFPHRLSRLLP